MADNTEHSAGARPGRRVWPLIFFLALAVVSALLHFEKSRWQRQALSARQQLHALAGAVPVAESKEQRGRFYRTCYYLGSAWKNSYGTADFVRRLSVIVPKRLQVADLKIVPGWQNLDFELSLAATADTAEAAHRIFMDFYHDVQVRIRISQAAFSEPARSAPAPGQAAKRFVFNMSGQVETE